MTNENRCGIIICVEKNAHHADLAHLVERDLAKVEVAGSSPVIRSIFFGNTENGSLAQLGEHLPYKQRVTGSSPVASTMNGLKSIGFRPFLILSLKIKVL